MWSIVLQSLCDGKRKLSRRRHCACQDIRKCTTTLRTYVPVVKYGLYLILPRYCHGGTRSQGYYHIVIDLRESLNEFVLGKRQPVFIPVHAFAILMAPFVKATEDNDVISLGSGLHSLFPQWSDIVRIFSGKRTIPLDKTDFRPVSDNLLQSVKRTDFVGGLKIG